VDDTSTYPHEEVDADVSLIASTVAHSATRTTAAAAVTHTTASTARSAPAPNRTPHSSSTTTSQYYLKTCDIAAAGYPAAPHAAPANPVTDTNDSTTLTTAAANVTPCVINVATGGIIAPAVLELPPALAWDYCDTPLM
jgi:hypothetical protein